VRAALTLAAALACLGPAAAAASTPIALAERQVTTLEFDRPVARLAVTDPDVLSLTTSGARVRVVAARAGRTSLEVAFEDGAVAAFDVVVEAARRPAGRAADAPGTLELLVGEERRIPAADVARVLVEESGAVEARAAAGLIVVRGLAPGAASLVVVSSAGERTTWSLRVR
jgi:Flp pilus assembly secretin CpaC